MIQCNPWVDSPVAQRGLHKEVYWSAASPSTNRNLRRTRDGQLEILMAAVDQALADFNASFVSLAEHWDSFLMERVDAQPLFWHDRIPREAYSLYTGLTHARNVYRGGLMDQAGTGDWRTIATSYGTPVAAGGSASNTYNNCLPPNPKTYNYAFEKMTWSGKEVAWASSVLCAEDLKFQDYATEQVALIIQTGVDFGLSIQETFNRENYTTMAVTAKRACIMTQGVTMFAGSLDRQFSYDPSVTTPYTDSTGAVLNAPYITYPSGLEVGTLNYEFLDFLREELSRRASGAALSRVANMPVFGFVADVRDWERMVMTNSELRADWRMANPSALIDSYNMAFRNLRGWMVVHDPSQMRFKILKDAGAGGSVTAVRILPMHDGRAGTIGQIPEPNPEYYNAELAIGVVFMNDILVNQFVPSITTVGSGTYFGPVDGLNGQWTWLNIPDKSTNPLGTIGNFYGRLQIFPKPGLYAVEATAVLYRRCPQIPQTGCAIESDKGTEQTSAPVAVQVAAVDADLDATNKTVWVRLAKPIAAGPGTAVSLKDSAGTAFAMLVADTSEAPLYKLAFQGAAPVVANLTTAATVTLLG